MIVKYGEPAKWFDAHGWLLNSANIEARDSHGWTRRSLDPVPNPDVVYVVPNGFEVTPLNALREGDTLIALGWNWVGRGPHDDEQHHVRVPRRDREYTVATVTPYGAGLANDLSATHARLDLIDPEDGELVHVTGGLPWSTLFLRKIA